jgi:hypothetical protein
MMREDEARALRCPPRDTSDERVAEAGLSGDRCFAARLMRGAKASDENSSPASRLAPKRAQRARDREDHSHPHGHFSLSGPPTPRATLRWKANAGESLTDSGTYHASAAKAHPLPVS